jgi:ATP-dependent helicase HrpB
MTDLHLLATVETWLGASLDKVRRREDFAKLDVLELLRSMLTWKQLQRLDALAPVSVTVPTGSNIRLDYSMDGRPPVLAVRLQEMFGLLDTPTINEGRLQVLLHLLSPGYKPVQVTQDLRSFWKNGYPEVRKELRLRYPRHSWPEDPWTAEAIRGAKPRKK